MKEFHNYHDQSSSQQLEQYRTSSIMDDDHMLLNQSHHTGFIDDSAYMYDMDFGGVIQSRTQTTLLHSNIGPSDLPPIYQPQHRASIWMK